MGKKKGVPQIGIKYYFCQMPELGFKKAWKSPSFMNLLLTATFLTGLGALNVAHVFPLFFSEPFIQP